MSKQYLNCKKINTAISRAKKMLIEKAKKEGFYENFGQTEVRNIKEKFIDLSDYTDEMNINRQKLTDFDNWCSCYNPNYRYLEV